MMLSRTTTRRGETWDQLWAFQAHAMGPFSQEDERRKKAEGQVTTHKRCNVKFDPEEQASQGEETPEDIDGHEGHADAFDFAQAVYLVILRTVISVSRL